MEFFKMMRNLERSALPFSVLWLCAFVTVFSGCAQRPRLIIEGDTVPLFKITGQGKVQILTVSGPDLDNPDSREAGSRHMKTFWEIVPLKETDIALLEQSGGIRYGQLPEGFNQIFPEHGGIPEPLVENELFTIQLRFANGEAVGARFVIHNGKAAVEGS